MVFEIGFSVDMMVGALVGSPLGYSINMLLVLALFNYFGTWEGYLVGVSLGTLYVLMIGIVEGFLVCLSLKIPLGSPLNSPNPELTVIILGIYLGNILV